MCFKGLAHRFTPGLETGFCSFFVLSVVTWDALPFLKCMHVVAEPDRVHRAWDAPSVTRVRVKLACQRDRRVGADLWQSISCGMAGQVLSGSPCSSHRVLYTVAMVEHPSARLSV